jgi:hypothetical protein
VLAPEVASVTAVRQLLADAAGAAFLAESADNPHDPTRLSMSGLGGCVRAAAYAVAGTPASDTPPPDEKRAAHLGTWQHNGLLPRMATALTNILGAQVVVEHPVELSVGGVTVPGRLDLALLGDVALTLDLKTVGEWRLHGVRRAGPYSEHRVQVLGYALAQHQAGHPVRWVAWLYMDRARGELEIIVEPFTNAAALAVVDQVHRIAWFANDNPDDAPREANGPGLSFACDGCPWLRRCWGDGAQSGVVGAQRTMARDDPGTQAAIALYDDARRRESEAKKDKEFARAILDGKPRGEYGPWELGWRPGGRRLNERQARELLTQHGEEVPVTQSAPSIVVQLVAAATGATPAGRD